MPKSDNIPSERYILIGDLYDLELHILNKRVNFSGIKDVEFNINIYKIRAYENQKRNS
jgi:hypothetical protein